MKLINLALICQWLLSTTIFLRSPVFADNLDLQFTFSITSITHNSSMLCHTIISLENPNMKKKKKAFSRGKKKKSQFIAYLSFHINKWSSEIKATFDDNAVLLSPRTVL